MGLKDLIGRIAEGWPAYHSKERVDDSEPTYDLVVRQFPQALQPFVDEYSITVQGSTSAGNITAAP